MIKTFKALSLLLTYPNLSLREALPDIMDVLKEDGVLSPPRIKEIQKLVDDINEGDLLDVQENYVLLFDRTRSLSLHIFEHVHGESRDRGQAMVNLQNQYLEYGLEIQSNELPDYIPIFLEFLSILEMDEAKEFLEAPLHIIAALKSRMVERETPYVAVMDALIDIAGIEAIKEEVDKVLEEPMDDPNDLKAIDEIWEEEIIKFGPEANLEDKSCPKVGNILEQLIVPNGDAPQNGKKV